MIRNLAEDAIGIAVIGVMLVGFALRPAPRDWWSLR